MTGRAIGRHRRSSAVRALHGFASFVESSYANEGSNLSDNGEEAILEKLKSSNFRIVFDVGANIGDWSSEAIASWPGCHVHAFEVAPPTFEVLRRRFDKPGLAGALTLNGLGLSDEAGTRQMYYFPDHPEGTCELPRHPGFRSVLFDAELVIGDKYCDSHQVDTVDFLKIDVEGSEYRVLRGFHERLSARKIHCIQFEYGAFAIQTKFLLGDYYAMLSKDYWIGKIYQGYVDFQDYDWRNENFRFSNYCCVSRIRPDIREILAG